MQEKRIKFCSEKNILFFLIYLQVMFFGVEYIRKGGIKMKSKNIDMCNGSLFRSILKFVIPFMLTGMMQQLYNTADMIVVGRFAGENALAGVGTTGPLVILIINFFMGLSTGVNVTLGRALGAKDTDAAKKVLHTAISISFLGGLFLSVFGIVFAEPLLLLIGVPETVLPQAKIYMQIIFSGQVAALVYNFGAAILQTKGDTKRPLFIIVISGLINVALNLFFVIGLGMEADGVALATVISQIFSAGAVLYLLMREEDEVRLNLKKLAIDKKQIGNILKIGVPSGIQSTVFSIANVLVQSSVNSFGAAAIAGSSVAGSIGDFYLILLNAFFNTSIVFVSWNMGAKKYDRIKKVIGCCLSYVGIIWAAEFVLTLIAGDILVGWYAPGNAEAIKMGVIKLNIIGCTYGLCGCMNVTSGALRGMGYSFTSMIVSIIGVCGIRILWILTVFQSVRDFGVLFLSYPFSWVGTFLMHSTICFFAVRKLKKTG